MTINLDAENHLVQALPMKILVAIKKVLDPSHKIHISADGKSIEKKYAKFIMNPFDAIALEEALRLKEKNMAQEIIVISIGETSNEEILRQALALGADQAILVNAQDQTLEPLHIAEILKSMVATENINLVLLGKQAIDNDCNQTGQMLAALLNWPQGTFASQLEIKADNITVSREVDEGLETLQLQLPAVITADLRLNEPRFPNMINIMKAKTKPLRFIPLDQIKVDIKPHTEILEYIYPKKRTKGKQIHSILDVMDIIRKNEIL